MNSDALYLNQLGIVCALGNGPDEIRARMARGESGVLATAKWSEGREIAVGEVHAALPSVDHLPLALRSRNNQMALAALAGMRDAVAQAIERYGPNRVGVVVGTSTSGIAEGEAAYRRLQAEGAFPDNFHYGQQELGSLAALLARTIGSTGPAYVHSSACASSAKAMASAARLIRMGLCDAVVTGGVDTLCSFTIAGFSALESISPERCNPLSANRHGINIGEGAGLFLMSRAPATVALRGWGESSDGHHMSAPDPQGIGATQAMQRALARAGATAAQVEYINMHGTATPQNDAMESRVLHTLFGDGVAVSSTKPLTGHALGAAGAIEAGLCWLVMQDDNATGLLPPHLWDGVADPALPALRVATPGYALGRPPRLALSNSFAFGGANAVLLLGRS